MGLDGQIEDTQNQVSAFPLNEANQLSAIRRDISQIDESIAQNEEGRQIIVSSLLDGTVTTCLVDPGQYIDPTTLLTNVVPDGTKLEAEVNVPSSAVGFIHVGGDILLRYDAFPYQKFGQFHATIMHVSATALQPGELKMLDGDKETYYRVTAALDTQKVEAYGQEVILEACMALDALLLLERRNIYEWILEPRYAVKGRLTDH